MLLLGGVFVSKASAARITEFRPASTGLILSHDIEAFHVI